MSLSAEICLGGWSRGQASKFVLGLGPRTHEYVSQAPFVDKEPLTMA